MTQEQYPSCKVALSKNRVPAALNCEALFVLCILLLASYFLQLPHSSYIVAVFNRTLFYLALMSTEELKDLYSSPNIVRVIKWRRMRWAGHVARMGEERGVYRV